MSSAIRRLTKDYLQYQANKDEFTLISATPLESNLFEWHVNICAPDGPYANVPLHFILTFPDNYPIAPPDVRLCTRIDHPNVWKEYDGTDAAWICLDMLKEYTASTKYEGWSSVYTVESILLQLQSFLFSENVPQDYGADQSLQLGNSSVVRSLNRIKNFKCSKCGHCVDKPVPALPKAYYDLLDTSVWKSGACIVASKGAVVNQNTVFWQEFPTWKTAAWDCGSLITNAGYHKFQYEVKIDWGWNGYYREDIRIGWGVITTKNMPHECDLNYKVIHESPADQGVWFWPKGMKVGDILTTAIDLQRKKVWYAVNGKPLPVQTYERNPKPGEDLVPIFRFRACRLLLNFETPTKMVARFRDSGFRLLEPKVAIAPISNTLLEWKKDQDACADVFPPQVFQVIVEFLPMCDIINARASCGSVRSLIEEAAIIPRREVHCFVTKQTWKEATLGVGLSCTKNEKLTLEEVQPNMEFLSLAQWESGYNTSAWGEELTDFLVLPISRMHCDMNVMVKYLEKFGANYRLGGGHSPSEILNILSKLMNMCVVTMMKETQGGKCNEKLLTGYTQFHHLLLALNERFPAVAQLAQKRVHNFIHKDAGRHKKETPDLGKLLVMASLCPGLNWKKFTKTLFVECCRRRVLWYLKECGSLANVQDSDDGAYCQKVFEMTEISRGVVAFQIAFLKIFALPKEGETLTDVLNKYYLRYGQPRLADMTALFERAQAIVKCQTWREHLVHVDMQLSGFELAQYLKNAVSQSLKAGYHRNERHHGRGKVSSRMGNPACAGLFRSASKTMKDFEHKAKFWLPMQYYSEAKAIAQPMCAKVFMNKAPQPIVIACHDKSGLAPVKMALKKAFPFLSLSPLAREHFELSFQDIDAHREQLKKAARTCCVGIKFPEKFAFPIATVLGSTVGIQKFHRALEHFLRKPVVRKFDLKQHQLCKRCDMTFPGLHGANVQCKSKPVSVTLKAHSEGEPLGAFWDLESLVITEVSPGGQFERFGVQEGMKITEFSSGDQDALNAGKKCSFVAQHECGFICRFCWPKYQIEMKAANQALEKRQYAKLRALEEEKKRQARLDALKKKTEDREKLKKQFPATFMILRLAQVRKGFSLKSEPVVALKRNTLVEVVELQENRVRISTPVQGWMSLVTKKGLLLDFRPIKMREFPAIGETNVHEEATLKLSMSQKPKKVVKQEKPQPWDCRVCGATGCFATRKYCFKCNAPKAQSDWIAKNPSKAKSHQKVEIITSASSSESGSSKSIQLTTPKVNVKAGKTYCLIRAAAIREKMDKKSKFVANLEENARVYVNYVDYKNLRARISSPYRGWISVWTKNGRLLK